MLTDSRQTITTSTHVHIAKQNFSPQQYTSVLIVSKPEGGTVVAQYTADTLKNKEQLCGYGRNLQVNIIQQFYTAALLACTKYV